MKLSPKAKENLAFSVVAGMLVLAIIGVLVLRPMFSKKQTPDPPDQPPPAETIELARMGAFRDDLAERRPELLTHDASLAGGFDFGYTLYDRDGALLNEKPLVPDENGQLSFYCTLLVFGMDDPAMRLYVFVDGVPTPFSVDGNDAVWSFVQTMQKNSAAFLPITVEPACFGGGEHFVNILVDPSGGAAYTPGEHTPEYLSALYAPVSGVHSAAVLQPNESGFVDMPVESAGQALHTELDTSVCLDGAGKTSQAAQNPYIAQTGDNRYEITGITKKAGRYALSVFLDGEPVMLEKGRLYLVWDCQENTVRRMEITLPGHTDPRRCAVFLQCMTDDGLSRNSGGFWLTENPV